jgi:hypothetical protein
MQGGAFAEPEQSPPVAPIRRASEAYTDRSSSDPRGRMRFGVVSPSPARGDALAIGAVGWTGCGATARARCTGRTALEPANTGADEKAVSEIGDNMRAVSAIDVKNA